MQLIQKPKPWTHPDWQWEVKWDGWRGLAYVSAGTADLVSRNGRTYSGFADLRRHIGQAIKGEAVFDGEIVCLDTDGKPNFDRLTSRCRDARFVAFDCLSVKGMDIRVRPLLERRTVLLDLIGDNDPMLRYSADFDDGVALFAHVVEMKLEGIVGKPRLSQYSTELATSWVKVLNRSYDRKKDRWKRFMKKA